MHKEYNAAGLPGLPVSGPGLNAFFSICGIYLMGILLAWYLTGVFKIPLPQDVTLKALAANTLQAVCVIVIPYIWAIRRLGFSLSDLGISSNKLVQSTILGCALYSLALAAFIHCSSDPLISNHAVRTMEIQDASALLAAMSIGAATTDLATRGFILFTLARYTNLPVAIIMQNATWFLGHISEINLLENCLGLWTAIGLTLTLGLLGDVIALKTRNVIGLSIAHIMLNIVLVMYIRGL